MLWCQYILSQCWWATYIILLELIYFSRNWSIEVPSLIIGRASELYLTAHWGLGCCAGSEERLQKWCRRWRKIIKGATWRFCKEINNWSFYPTFLLLDVSRNTSKSWECRNKWKAERKSAGVKGGQLLCKQCSELSIFAWLFNKVCSCKATMECDNTLPVRWPSGLL